MYHLASVHRPYVHRSHKKVQDIKAFVTCFFNSLPLKIYNIKWPTTLIWLSTEFSEELLYKQA